MVVTPNDAVEEPPRSRSSGCRCLEDCAGDLLDGAGSVDADVGGAVVAGSRHAHGDHPLKDVAGQHGPLLCVSLQPAEEDLVRGVQPGDDAGMPEGPAVERVDDRAAARCDHRAIDGTGSLDGRRLDGAEGGLSARRDELRGVGTLAPFDLDVEVDERAARSCRDRRRHA